MTRRGTSFLGPGLLACLVGSLIILTGCTVPAAPDRAAWRSQAAQALEDTASDVATVELVLRQERQDRLPGKYAVVVAVDSEESAGKSGEAFTSLQPPPGQRAAYDRVGQLLDDAQGLLSEARIALADGATGDYPPLIARLARLGDRLERVQGRFG